MDRLLLAFPRYTMVEGTLVDEVLKLLGGTPVSWVACTSEHNQAFHNMNLMIARGLSMPRAAWDRIVFIEQDHRFPKDTLVRIAQYQHPVVGALYWKHNDIGVSVPGMWDASREEIVPLTQAQVREMRAQRTTVPVDILGTCLLSIDRQVLLDWPSDEPWFRPEYHRRKLIGYEVWFCLMCKKLGIPVMLDSGMEIDHYARIPIRDRLPV